MNLTKKDLQYRLNISEIEYILYVIETMKSHQLTFAMFEFSEIEDPDGLTSYLWDNGKYEVIIENETFKILWK